MKMVKLKGEKVASGPKVPRLYLRREKKTCSRTVGSHWMWEQRNHPDMPGLSHVQAVQSCRTLPAGLSQMFNMGRGA